MAVRLWAFFLLGFHLAACFPFGWLVRQLGGLPPVFSLTFSFGVVSLHGSWSGFCRGSPLRVVSSCSFLEGDLPPLWRWRVWMAESSRPIRSSGRLPGACLILSSSPLALHGVVSTSPVCLSRGSGRSHACGRFRGIALGPGAGFPFVSLPGGRVV